MQNDANCCDVSLYKILIGVGGGGSWMVWVGWSWMGGVGHTGVGWGGVWWVMQGWVGYGGSCRGGWGMVGHAGVGWGGSVIEGGVRYGGSCRGGIILG